MRILIYILVVSVLIVIMVKYSFRPVEGLVIQRGPSAEHIQTVNPQRTISGRELQPAEQVKNMEWGSWR